jgi:hypothetical protein
VDGPFERGLGLDVTAGSATRGAVQVPRPLWIGSHERLFAQAGCNSDLVPEPSQQPNIGRLLTDRFREKSAESCPSFR